MPCLHPLYTRFPLPERLNNPFGYIPSPLCRQAAEATQQYLMAKVEWHEELSHGKMFGVLVVEDKQGALGFLAAYSGLLAERNDWEWFVPAVFDFQRPERGTRRKSVPISG